MAVAATCAALASMHWPSVCTSCAALTSPHLALLYIFPACAVQTATATSPGPMTWLHRSASCALPVPSVTTMAPLSARPGEWARRVLVLGLTAVHGVATLSSGQTCLRHWPAGLARPWQAEGRLFACPERDEAVPALTLVHRTVSLPHCFAAPLAPTPQRVTPSAVFAPLASTTLWMAWPTSLRSPV